VIALRAPALRLDHLLGGATAACALMAVWPWLFPPVPATRPLATAPASTPAPALSALPPLTNFSAIVERPLFSPSRRPPPGVSAAAGPLVASRYRLLGVLATGPKKRAFLADGARRVDVAEGERLDGWTVKQIGADSVRLSSSDGEAVLTLKPAVQPEPPAKPQ
jgi:hypothetical protein